MRRKDRKYSAVARQHGKMLRALELSGSVARVFKAFQEAYNYLMNHPDDLQRWGQAWKVAGVHLAGERAARLRAMTGDETRKIIARIFSGPQPPAVERESGLLEQQRLFRKLR